MLFSKSAKQDGGSGFFFDGDRNAPADSIDVENEVAHAAMNLPRGSDYDFDPAGRILIIPASAPPAPTQSELISQYEAALDAHLDAVAQQHRYRDRVTFAMRAGYPGPWQAEGTAFGTWMDTCNAQAYAMLQDVPSGAAEMPTIEEFIAELPEFVLP